MKFQSCLPRGATVVASLLAPGLPSPLKPRSFDVAVGSSSILLSAIFQVAVPCTNCGYFPTIWRFLSYNVHQNCCALMFFSCLIHPSQFLATHFPLRPFSWSSIPYDPFRQPCPTGELVCHLPLWVCNLIQCLIPLGSSIARVSPVGTSLREPVHPSTLARTSAAKGRASTLPASLTCFLWSSQSWVGRWQSTVSGDYRECVTAGIGAFRRRIMSKATYAGRYTDTSWICSRR